ncbi:hypothetical protein SD70_24470 [Gordoniibacillus kamchatkensis]|uniref:Restriction endonuclease subunit S n=1 Tax=Gordoniibacillus kamchatkensis TaxID=1590651 RepID=A0ABR5ACH7_9BACL|nr:hypothetical protein [Paenibacillus sp. VKM B-2647]KIL38760.1 hypothetical protein SD70_24470 [Paenibacillus sp. VKM B-2647]
MSREHSLRKILHSVTRFQEEVADILGAKATEAEKVRNWITLHMLPHETDDYEERLKLTMGIHDQMIEVIDGLTRMESSLGQHLKVLIGQEEPGGQDGPEGIGPPHGQGGGAAMYGGGMGGK